VQEGFKVFDRNIKATDRVYKRTTNVVITGPSAYVAEYSFAPTLKEGGFLWNRESGSQVIYDLIGITRKAIKGVNVRALSFGKQ
jgi:hypothetical protein